jgi:hypothetical protein
MVRFHIKLKSGRQDSRYKYLFTIFLHNLDRKRFLFALGGFFYLIFFERKVAPDGLNFVHYICFWYRYNGKSEREKAKNELYQDIVL